LIAVLLAWLTYKLIERPIRTGKYGNKKAICLVLLMFAIGSLGYLTRNGNGFPFRGPALDGIESGNDGGYPAKLIDECGLPVNVKKGFVCLADSRGPIKYALIGDSKAEAIFSGFVRTSNEHGRWLIIAKGRDFNPVPVISDEPAYSEFQLGTEIALKAIIKNPEIDAVVIVVGARNLFKLKNDTDIYDLANSTFGPKALAGLQLTVDELRAANKKVIFLIDNPTLPHPEDCVERKTSSEIINLFLNKSINLRCQISIDEHFRLSQKYRDLLTDIAKRNQDTVSLFDSTPFMCNKNNGICESKQNGKRMYVFTDHVSDYAAGLIGKELNVFLNQLIRQMPDADVNKMKGN
jgi:hypothetical protein